MMANKDELKMQLEIQTQRFEEQQERNLMVLFISTIELF